jgi:DNA-binding NarL/FixJ family response regulator
MPKSASAIVVAAPGRLREGWRALLLAAPIITAAHEVDAETALSSLQEHRPDLVLMDANGIGDAIWSLLRTIRSLYPQTRVVAVVNSSDQECEAGEAGADAVLFRGFSAEELFAIVRSILGMY